MPLTTSAQACRWLLSILEEAGTFYGNKDLEELAREITEKGLGGPFPIITAEHEAITFKLPDGAEYRVHHESAPHRGTYLVVIQVGRGALHIEPQANNAVRIYAPDAKPNRG